MGSFFSMEMVRTLTFILLVVALVFQPASALTQNQENELRGVLRNWILTHDGNQNGDTVAEVVRVVFHDAGTFNRADGTGGPHACIAKICSVPDECEFTATENKGMQNSIRGLMSAYEDRNLQSVLTKADWLHLAGAVAVEIASRGAVSLPFKWGRTECATSSARPRNSLPTAHWGRDEILPFFRNRLGFSTIETIALLGAHSIGRGQVANSGFEGTWDRTPTLLDNLYFQDMVNDNIQWERARVGSSGVLFWKPKGIALDTMMLDADVGMFWRVCGLNPGACNFCQITHDSSGCQPFQELDIAKSFAANNNVFLSQFRAAFIKMQELGQIGLKQSCLETDSFCRQGEPSTSSGSPAANTNTFSSGFTGSTTTTTTSQPIETLARQNSDTKNSILNVIQTISEETAEAAAEAARVMASSTTTSTPAVLVPKWPANGPPCPDGLLPTDMNANGLWDCLESNAPCNPTPCPAQSILCGGGRGCTEPGNSGSCPSKERAACAIGFVTCGDGGCKLLDILCGATGVRFPAKKCA
eukprot:gb/GEZN01003941.1/.p1 GENE.gb/GEZN01003941.1/~~gb/GEZN01003941.1/.p1  ORF type:complete len:530 (-),score=63.70 gb/GEZN01003941.1/:389-1978(-)